MKISNVLITSLLFTATMSAQAKDLKKRKPSQSEMRLHSVECYSTVNNLQRTGGNTTRTMRIMSSNLFGNMALAVRDVENALDIYGVSKANQDGSEYVIEAQNGAGKLLKLSVDRPVNDGLFGQGMLTLGGKAQEYENFECRFVEKGG